MVWSNTFNKTGRTIVQTSDSGYLITGNLSCGLLKIDSVGSEQWTQTTYLGGHAFYDILPVSDGNYILTGSYGWDGVLIKVDSMGNEIWHKSYSPVTQHVLRQSVELTDGSIVATGSSGLFGWLMKTDSEGNLLWHQQYNPRSSFNNILATDDGGFLLSGQALNAGTVGNNAWLLKVDSMGHNPDFMVGIDEKAQTVKVELWPNPATESLIIKLNEFQKSVTISIVNNLGQMVYSNSVSASQTHFTVPISNWATGIYSVVVQDELKAVSKRLVKQ